mmetsp:Transcript_92770/g.198913  ORF Transcript_92770/g.198913 Transcript_92770/m.198913 type:complete len:256 (+) Transcript_92770:65-832(+)
MSPLSLSLLIPKGGGKQEDLSVEAEITGQDLKVKVQEVLSIAPEHQLLFFQNGSRNAAKVALDDVLSLAAQDVEDGATITVKVNEKEVKSENSALRDSISKNGGSSYYYAHANEKALPPEQRYVYGGAPAKLAEAEAEAAAASLQEAAPAKAIAKYAWADEGDFVCIYISAEDEAEALEAAKDGKNGEVKVEFELKSAELRISGSARNFALVLKNLENEIVPEESKHRVSAGKRVTLKLKKKRQVKWSRLVKPQT